MGGISVILMLPFMFLFLAVYAIILILAIVIGIYTIISYFLESIFLFKVMKNNNLSNPIRAFIPCYKKYLFGKIANLKNIGFTASIISILVPILILLLYLPYQLYNFVEIFSGLIIMAIPILIITQVILNIIMTHKILLNISKKFTYQLTIINIATLGLSRLIELLVLNKKIVIKNL